MCIVQLFDDLKILCVFDDLVEIFMIQESEERIVRGSFGVYKTDEIGCMIRSLIFLQYYG